MASDPSRRRILSAITVLGLAAGGGCLTLDPAVRTETDDGAVFERVSTTEPWAGRSLVATVRLAPEATTTRGVTRLVVITEGGTQFDATKLATGVTRTKVYLPTNQNATILAVNTANGTVVAREPVATGGNRLF
jgi:hypothetical protein